MQNRQCLAEAFLEQSPACHWILDAQGVFEEVFGNPAPLFEKSAPELRGRALREVLGPEAAATWERRAARVFGGETLFLRERRAAAAWSISFFPILEEGHARFAGGLAHEKTPWDAAEQELRYTVLGALKAQEYERGQISRFLHDSVGQNLTAFGLQLDLVRMDLETVSSESCARILETQNILGTLMEEVREYSYALNPSAVERAGLRSALDRLIGRLRHRFLGTVRLNVDPSLRLEQKLATAMYHIAQEAVENAVQHSGCSAIEIAVKSSRIGSYLEVKDNGRGFDSADVLAGRRGLGLLSMEHYAAQAGLELSITSVRDMGTTVRAATFETG